MIVGQSDGARQDRMAEIVRKVLTHRERAPRSPRMERALKRLLWRYSQATQQVAGKSDWVDDQEAEQTNNHKQGGCHE